MVNFVPQLIKKSCIDMRTDWVTLTSSPRLLIRWVILSWFCILALVIMLGTPPGEAYYPVLTSSASEDSTYLIPLKQQVVNDYRELSSLVLAVNQRKQFPRCGKEWENFVPCYNISASLLFGFKNGEEFDRHCQMRHVYRRCLVRPPKEYKAPLKWPTGQNVIWRGNVKITKDQFFSSGSMTKRMMLLPENQIAFHSDEGLAFDGVKDYSGQIAGMIGLGSDHEFIQAGVRAVLDIGCGFGSFVAHLMSLKVMAICIAAYEATGSQVQLTLERGLPAMIGNFISRQLPYPSLSFDMVHCARCGINWDEKDGKYILEVDRVLKPGGHFVLTIPKHKSRRTSSNMELKLLPTAMEELTKEICWSLVAQQDDTFIWRKTSYVHCYSSCEQAKVPLCEGYDAQTYYQPLVSCISGPTSKRWTSVQNRSSSYLSSDVHPQDFFNDQHIWRSALKNYWSLFSPVIFSDHPKRPGFEDPLPPYNMLRNVMDMNAHYGGFNSAFLAEGKSVWVMNVVPLGAPNTLPLILAQGFAGVLHDWCEPFPTYPRTYDMLHGNGLLSQYISGRCSVLDLLLEMDRILRPEGWVILQDESGTVDMVRRLVSRMHWEARTIDIQDGSRNRLLICQKPSSRK